MFSGSYFKVGAGAVPREGRNLHPCEDRKYLTELGWSLTRAGPEGKKEENPKENTEVQEVLVHRISCEKPAGEGGH